VTVRPLVAAILPVHLGVSLTAGSRTHRIMRIIR
jgi:hypothetical protein